MGVPTLEVIASLFASYGIYFLLVAFILEGALVGKVIPTRALFIGAVLALGSDFIGIMTLAGAAIIGATIGQLVIFILVRRTSFQADALPSAGSKWIQTRLQSWFRQWGIPAIVISNSLPLTRGYLTIPAALTETDMIRFSSAALAGTTVYTSGLLAIAISLDIAISIV